MPSIDELLGSWLATRLVRRNEVLALADARIPNIDSTLLWSLNSSAGKGQAEGYISTSTYSRPGLHCHGTVRREI